MFDRFVGDQRITSSTADATHVLLVASEFDVSFVTPSSWPTSIKGMSSREGHTRQGTLTCSSQCNTLVDLWRDHWRHRNPPLTRRDQDLPMSISDPNRHLNEKDLRDDRPIDFLTRNVELKWFLTSVNRHGNRSLKSQGFLQSCFISLRNIHETITGSRDRFSTEFTRGFVLSNPNESPLSSSMNLYFAHVRIGGLVIEPFVVMDIFECIVHQTTVATVVTPIGRAIDQLLFT